MEGRQSISLVQRILDRLKAEVCEREHLWRPVGKPEYPGNAPLTTTTCFNDNKELGEWYSPVLISPRTIGDYACSAACINDVIEILKRLEPDPYTRYLLAYYEEGLRRFGNNWKYADITTMLLAAGRLIHPENYLEIGVRRGRSMAMVAAACPRCNIVGFDMWIDGYGHAENPGPEFVRKEMQKVGFKGNLVFVNGDSHQTLSCYFEENPDVYFDLITVDGDHTNRGASLDLKDVLPRLKIGGAIVFDDIVQPRLEYLQDVWHRYVAGDYRYSTWEYKELGYGIAVGIRKY
ncbi:MAG: class I SAM-dependent methyltransferase [Candidatus Omnitrophota bacterium]